MEVCLSRSLVVPTDAPSLEVALSVWPHRKITLSPGSYALPKGLVLHGPFDIAGEGKVELVLGGPLVLTSDAGGKLRNLEIHSGNGNDLQALVCVRSSFVIAQCANREWPAKCSWGQSPVLLQNCKLYGGRHGLDARGFEGLHPRGGHRRKSVWQTAEPRWMFNFSAWLELCTAHAEPSWGGSLRFEVSDGQDTPVPPGAHSQPWIARRGTRVCLLECEITATLAEAVHSWRGAHLEMRHCTVSGCGQGVTVSQCDPDMQRHSVGGARLILEDNIFEGIENKGWSSAASLGCLVSTTNGQLTHYRSLAGTHTPSAVVSRSVRPIVAVLTRNIIRRCSVGIVASGVQLEAQHNMLADISFSGWQLHDISAHLTDNCTERCGGPGVGISAAAGSRGRFERNTYRHCVVGLRMSSAGGAPCHVDMREDVFESNGDGAVIRSSGCFATWFSCAWRHSTRCGLRVGRAAQARLEHCSVSGNGRGVVVAAASSAQVRSCSFEDNLGWALRFEADRANGEQTSCRSDGPSEVSNNIFGSVTRGNVGRKRVRIDAFAGNVAAAVQGNVEAVGRRAVEVQVKRHRTLETEIGEATARFAELGLRTPAVYDL
mmetsp:Transcript_72031/g.166846  ORF Transcript_72031/g.166846 Transcript_72031/m.166846 type:complete len:602 (+) Transcript_72031:109-1914(+)